MASKDIITTVSTKLFMSRGVKSVTMDDIATECGMSKRTLYEQFHDKSELLEACINDMNCRNDEKMDQIIKSSGNVLEVLLKIHEYQARATEDMYANFYNELKKCFPEVYQKTISAMRACQLSSTEFMLKQGQKEGVFIPQITDNIPITAVAITRMIDVIKNADVFKEDNNFSMSQKSALKSMMIVFLRGISTEKGRKIVDEYIATKNNNNL